MSKVSHAGEPFEVDRGFAFFGGSATTEQRDFDDWRRGIGGWVGDTSTATRTQSDAPPVAQKCVDAVHRHVEPKVPRAAAAASAKPGMPLEKVCWIQNVLNKANGEILTEDGAYGSASRAAVVRFQTGHGLASDGIVGPRTEVALIRAALNQIAKASLVPVSGVMDPQTSQQIRRFQSASKLVPDGIVGLKTRAAMAIGLGGRCLMRLAGPRPPTPGQQRVEAEPSRPTRVRSAEVRGDGDAMSERCRPARSKLS
jgi:peptidoglycan hydrolase-like protein with peptidoglycan-binding domain